MNNLKEQINLEKLPRHIAIIMDGNGRWAKEQGHLRMFGHENGVTSVREVAEASAELGIEYVTLYAFSTENWNRPQQEVDALMHLLVETINLETKTLNDNNIRLLAIGDLEQLPEACRENLQKAIDATKNNSRMTLVLALSYSARWEMVQAMRKIAVQVKNGEIDVDQIDDNTISNSLATAGMPDPELMIRTSGEHRISNFLLWQLAYSELSFPSVLWPDFRREHLYSAILDFQNRERRFGMTSEQLINQNH